MGRCELCFRRLSLSLVWALMLCVLSIPSVLYSMSTAVPGGNNILGLGVTVLEGFQHAAAAMLSVISDFVTPSLATLTAGALLPGESRAGMLLMMSGRLVVILIVPVHGGDPSTL